MIDLGRFGGGRAENDYSNYNVDDFLFTPRGFWVIEGDVRKTTRLGSNGKHIARGPFFVPDAEGAADGPIARLMLVIGGFVAAFVWKQEKQIKLLKKKG